MDKVPLLTNSLLTKLIKFSKYYLFLTYIFLPLDNSEFLSRRSSYIGKKNSIKVLQKYEKLSHFLSQSEMLINEFSTKC